MIGRNHGRAVAIASALVLAAAAWAAATASGAPHAAGKTFTMAVPAVPDELDPAKWSGLPHSDLSPAIGGTLVRYTIPKPGTDVLDGPADVEPELARSIKRSAGGYTIVLRPARSPFGNTVSAKDVKWSFDRMRALDFIAQFLMSVGGIDGKNPITVLGPDRFRLNVTSPSLLTLAVLHRYDMGILDSTEVAKHATAKDKWAESWLATHSASYGPYAIESFSPGAKLRLVANPNYWRGAPHFTTVVAAAIPESSTRLQLLQTGRVDYADFLGFDQFKAIQHRKGLKPVSGLEQRRDVLVLATAFKPFADARVRQAISLGIDRAAIVRAAYQGFARPALWPQSSAIPQPRPPAATLTRYDPARAKSLLAAAGYGSGLSFTLTVSPQWSGAQVQPLAELIQSQLAKLGVTVKIDVKAAAAEFQKARTDGSLQAFVDLENPVVVDIGYNLLLYYTTKGIQNVSGYSTPRLDALDKQLLRTFAPAKRAALIRQADTILARDQPWVPLVETINTVAFRSGICGFWSNPERVVYISQLTDC
jgi:peptide/nickel transport system substrate-binding protein